MKGGQPPFFLGGNSHDGVVRLMGRDSRALHRHFGLIACGVVLALVTGLALANSVGVTPTGIRYNSQTPGGVNTTATMEARYTGTVNGVRHYNVPVPVSTGTLGSLAKGAVKRGLGAYAAYSALKGIVDAAGWAIDELSQQVYDGPKEGPTQQPAGTWMLCRGINGVTRCSSTPELFLSSGLCTMAAAGETYCTEIRSCPGPGSACTFRRNDGASVSATWTQVQEWTPDFGTGTDPQPVSDAAFGELVKQHPQVINAVLIDPVTGAPIRTPELVEAMNNLRKELEAAGGMDPGPDAAPVDPSETQPMESDWPMFCGWATTVCDFIDWMREEPPTEEKPEVPWDEQPIEQVQWSSGLGGGSCPAPVVVPINFNGHNSTVEFEFTPMCSFASTMRPILIAIAMLLAGFILAGLRENKGA